MGTPGQSLKLAVDTTKSDFWVLGKGLRNEDEYKSAGSTLFDPLKSSSFEKDAGSSWSDGLLASGPVGTDVVSFAGLTIPAQTVEVAMEASIKPHGLDGVFSLGLAASEPFGNGVRPVQAATPLQNLATRGSLKADMFAITLQTSGDGTLSFGYYDTGLIEEPVHEIALNKEWASKGLYVLDLPKVQINDKVLEQDHGSAILLDSGTALTYLTTALVKELYFNFPESHYNETAGGWIYSVTTTHSARIKFSLGSSTIELPPRELCFRSLSDGFCFGVVQDRGSLPYNVYGDSLFKWHTVAFYPTDRKVGIARRAMMSWD